MRQDEMRLLGAFFKKSLKDWTAVAQKSR